MNIFDGYESKEALLRDNVVRLRLLLAIISSHMD